MGEKILANLRITPRTIDMSKWEAFLANIDASTDVLRVAMVGKYVGLEDAYYSLNEGLKCAGYAHKQKIKLEFVEAEEIEIQ